MSSELERDFLAAVMLTPEVIDLYDLVAEDFGPAQHVAIYRAILELKDSGQPVGTHTVLKQLERTLEGEALRSAQERAVALGDHLHGHPLPLGDVAHELKYASQVRRAQDGLLRAVERLSAGSLEEGLQAAAEAIQQAEGGDRGQDTWSARDVMRDGVRSMLESAQRTDKVQLGIREIDDWVGTLESGDLVIIAADTGVGKTTTALMIAMTMAKSGAPVGYVSCEDNRDKLAAKLLGFGCNLRAKDIRAGRIPPSEQDAIVRTVEAAQGLPLFCTFPVCESDAVVSQSMAKLVRKHGCRALFVDYVQTINGTDHTHSRRDEVRRVASRLKRTAHRLGVPLILMSQVARPPSDKRGKPRKPSKHDLKEAGDLENMAEMVIILWPDVGQVLDREGRPKPGEFYENKNVIRACVEKSKWGGDGVQWRMRRNEYGVLALVDEYAEAAE